MTTAIRLFVTVLLAAGVLNAAGFEKEAKSGQAAVVMTSAKALAVGNNRIEMLVTLDNAAAAEGTAVTLKVFMPAMPGMPAMESTVVAQSLGNGRFKADLNFSMPGTWQVHIMIIPETGRKIRVKTSVNI